LLQQSTPTGVLSVKMNIEIIRLYAFQSQVRRGFFRFYEKIKQLYEKK